MSPIPLQPIFLSLKIASIATLITLALGLSLARLLTYRKLPLRSLWETLVLLPMVFPPTITGYLLLLLLGNRGPLGTLFSSLGIQIVFTWVAAVIASCVVTLPLMYQSCKAAILDVDPRLIEAGRTLGLGENKIFFRIVVPIASPGILGGVALCFARALGEFGATLMVAGNIPGKTQTIPVALYGAVEGGHVAEANLYLVVTVVLSFLLVGVVGFAERAVRKARHRTHRNTSGAQG